MCQFCSGMRASLWRLVRAGRYPVTSTQEQLEAAAKITAEVKRQPIKPLETNRATE